MSILIRIIEDKTVKGKHKKESQNIAWKKKPKENSFTTPLFRDSLIPFTNFYRCLFSVFLLCYSTRCILKQSLRSTRHRCIARDPGREFLRAPLAPALAVFMNSRGKRDFMQSTRYNMQGAPVSYVLGKFGSLPASDF